MAIYLVTGMSGVGKTTIMKRASQWYANKVLGEVISHTTREPRVGEVQGEAYYFISDKDFKSMLNNNMFAENVTYAKNHYGISKNEIENKLAIYKNVYIIVEYEGYKQIKEVYPEAIGIFLHMSKEDCFANMLLRGDSLEKANERIKTYDEEASKRSEYDYVVKNVRGKQRDVVSIIASIIKANE